VNINHYNYFSNELEWKNYAKGYWSGRGISMVISEKEPYEQNLQTTVTWKIQKNRIVTRFKRDKVNQTIYWVHTIELFADKIKLTDETESWNAEFQAMTETKSHLHVESIRTKNLILFSGIIEKTNPIKQLLFF